MLSAYNDKHLLKRSIACGKCYNNKKRNNVGQ